MAPLLQRELGNIGRGGSRRPVVNLSGRAADGLDVPWVPHRMTPTAYPHFLS